MFRAGLTKATATVVIAMAVFSGSCKKDPGPHAAFTMEVTCSGGDSCQVQFTNQSVGARSYLWQMGDGSTSVDTSPVHIYQYGHLYPVTLEAIGEQGLTQFHDTIYLGGEAACEAKGGLDCVKKLTNRQPIIDLMLLLKRYRYYYFIKERPGPVFITMRNTPTYGVMTFELYGSVPGRSTAILSVPAARGKPVNLWADSLPAGEYYVQLFSRDLYSRYINFLVGYSETFTEHDEPNNGFETASPLFASIPAQGTIKHQGDEDYFIFNLPAARVLDFTVDPVPVLSNQGTLYVEVFSKDTLTSRVMQVACTGARTTFSAGPLDSGEHYVRIYGTAGESPDLYRLTMRYDTTDGHENNQIFATATEITGNQVLKATIKSAGDVDCYKFTAMKTGTATITIPYVPDELTTMELQLYHLPFEHALIDGRTAPAKAPLTLTASVISGQIYYIKVSAANRRESNRIYEISIQ